MRVAEAGGVIGGHELVRRIGRGGMAEVWVARRPLGERGSKFVALKLIAEHFVGDERYARMFRAEAELAAVLSHANIVQVFDEGQQDGRSYLVMEWVDGLNLLKLGDVLSLLDDDERRFRVIAYIIGQLLHALDYAHSITSLDGSPLGVVHRDVSPQNVLVSNHGEVKLTDFGVAFHNFEESSGMHVKGKVRYMAPEQIRGQSRHASVDLFAVGALLHELLDGHKFRGELDDGQELFTAVLAGHVGPLRRPAPPELEDLRRALLEPDPSRRLRTAEEALAMLKQYAGYGDARNELSKLCGSLTGVVRPRAGPGGSWKPDADDRRTMRCDSRRPLVPPKVSPSPKPPPPPPPSSSLAARRASTPTGSRTAVKNQRRTLPTITGHTEVVVFPAMVSNAPACMPPTTHPAAALGPTSHVWPEAPPMGSIASEPIAVRSGLTTVLEVPEVTMSSELGSGSATERELAPNAVPGDGSDSSRASGPRPSTGPDSVSIVLSKRSAMAALGVGLLLVAAVSVSLTWLMFAGRRAAATLADAVALGVLPGDRPHHPDVSDDDTAVAPANAEGSLPSESTPNAGAPNPALALVRAPPDEPTSDDDVESASGTPAAKVARKAKEPVGKANVKVTSSTGLEGAQIRIGSKVLRVDERREQVILAGRRAIKWRRSAGEPWQRAKSVRFGAGQHFVIHIGKHGPNIRSK
ncbi:serine/threonine-protein kinase [Paraliomyxa miuraensis]|uniref:serine/threonine-protein kinase n=1 Tax=Paraliomyxa miuraensis TaxID=376150 RepID=UPI002252017E|nr:serine/threonine-protein kinase [Paraliomyxa miuraensis]MCX4247919.1 protein kinase [Paraliomyxa miuraensis]